MKSFASLVMSFVLTAGMMTGCGCTNRNVDTSTPTTMVPTTAATTTPSTASTEMTTAPTNGATQNTDETINHGNGPLVEGGTETTQNTTETTVPGRARQNMPIQ